MNSTRLNFIFKRKNPLALAIFRIFFGLTLFYEFKHLKNILLSLQNSRFFVQYDFFNWVKLPNEIIVNFISPLCLIICVFFTIGFLFRFSSIALFVVYTYCFFIDKSHYNNHYYLYCILLFFFSITQSNRKLSIDSKIPFFSSLQKNYITNWQYLIFQFQILIVYFFGGIAKIQSDWLNGFPLRFWLYENSFNFNGFLRNFYRFEYTAYFYSYLGLIFDLCIGFMFFHKKMRWLALIPVVFFHISNIYLWNIGSFPFVMIACLILFFSDLFTIKEYEFDSYQFNGFKQKLVFAFIFIFFSFQLLFPLRQHLFKGNPSFNGQGHLFAWRMMLVDNLDAFRMKIIIPETDDEFYIDPLQYMNFRQFKKMSRTPLNYLAFAHFIRDEISKNSGIANPVVKLEIYKSVNGRTPSLLNDTTLNYAEIKYNPLISQQWINDWTEQLEKPSFSIQKYDRWKDVLDQDY